MYRLMAISMMLLAGCVYGAKSVLVEIDPVQVGAFYNKTPLSGFEVWFNGEQTRAAVRPIRKQKLQLNYGFWKANKDIYQPVYEAALQRALTSQDRNDCQVSQAKQSDDRYFEFYFDCAN